MPTQPMMPEKLTTSAHRARLLRPHAEDIDAPTIEEEQHERGDIRGQDEQQPVIAHARERAHEPVDDLREFFLRVSGEFQQRDERGEKRTDKHPREDHGHGRAPLAPCEEEGQPDRDDAERERRDLHRRRARREHDGKRRAEARTVADAEGVGTGERVAKERLKDAARDRQPAAREHGGDDARQAHVVDHRDLHGRDIRGKRPCHVCGEDVKDVLHGDIVRSECQ